MCSSDLGAFFSLMTPVIIIGGIMSGLFTPTEASVVACLYAIVLGFLYKDLKLQDLPRIMWDTVKASAGLLFIMAVANFFGWFVMYRQIPNKLIETLASIGAGANGVMAIIIAVVLADAEAARIYAEAYNRDPEFYAFWKSMESYANTLKGRDATYSTNMDYFRYLYSPEGRR